MQVFEWMHVHTADASVRVDDARKKEVRGSVEQMEGIRLRWLREEWMDRGE
jgi:hypothetical protein